LLAKRRLANDYQGKPRKRTRRTGPSSLDRALPERPARLWRLSGRFLGVLDPTFRVGRHWSWCTAPGGGTCHPALRAWRPVPGPRWLGQDSKPGDRNACSHQSGCRFERGSHSGAPV